MLGGTRAGFIFFKNTLPPTGGHENPNTLNGTDLSANLNRAAQAALGSRGPRYKGVLYSPERFAGRLDPDAPQFHMFQFQYNPATMRVTRELDYGEIDTPGSVVPDTFFAKGRPNQISFTLDMQSKLPDTQKDYDYRRTYGVEADVAALEAFTYSDDYLLGREVDYAYRRVPKTVFSLGRRFAMPVWIRRIEMHYLEWSQDMVPTRVSADVELMVSGLDPTMLAWIRSIGDYAAKHAERTDDRVAVDERLLR